MKQHCYFTCGPWSEWNYISSESCIQERKCLDCLDGREKRTIHDWSDWSKSFSNKKNLSLKSLREYIDWFSSKNESEVRYLCTKMDIIYQNINTSSNIKYNFVNLIVYCHNTNCFEKLINVLKNNYQYKPLSLIDINSLNDVNFNNLSFSIFPNDTCLKVRKCKRCGEIEYNEVHNFTEKKHICDIYEICNICGKEKYIETRHKLTNFEYESSKSCRKRRFCMNPNCEWEEFDDGNNHTWEDWKYDKDGSCETSRICSRCDKKEATIIHEWSKFIKTDKGNQFKECNRCGRLSIIDFGGKWQGYAKWTNNNVDYWELSLELFKPGLFSTNNIRGNLFVTYMYNGQKCYTEEKINGFLDTSTGELNFKGKVINSQTKYKSDEFSGFVIKGCTEIKGTIHSFNNGEIILK